MMFAGLAGDNNLSCAYNRKCEYDKAIEHHMNALEIQLMTLGPQHSDAAHLY